MSGDQALTERYTEYGVKWGDGDLDAGYRDIDDALAVIYEARNYAGPDADAYEGAHLVSREVLISKSAWMPNARGSS